MKTLILVAALALSGCSATQALSGLVGSKPDITAQAGAENVKQTVGVTAKNETSNDTKIESSNVGKVETANKKVESINAGTIQADRIEVTNNGESFWFAGIVMAAWIITEIARMIVNRRNNKGA